ncbi:hypothetical protein QMK19_40765 [Streptomyces sp. H10-C2]|uniref:hypothetical protein n=1 Tax=unclassified Streptomyces TaxID=2593676 RepID=UPI0024B9D41F|nr:MULTISPECIES: hypothetical protein [unclassified Streptomyces]MDJ0346833.1 hypothetical protein [Streptomyces sp. PH10-H1]MDJ0375737.1 hypothetical protein [Streptomyces sp. H10-C2]
MNAGLSQNGVPIIGVASGTTTSEGLLAAGQTSPFPDLRDLDDLLPAMAALTA